MSAFFGKTVHMPDWWVALWLASVLFIFVKAIRTGGNGSFILICAAIALMFLVLVVPQVTRQGKEHTDPVLCRNPWDELTDVKMWAVILYSATIILAVMDIFMLIVLFLLPA